MTSNIAKTIARQQEKIAAGSFYEAHQQLRVIAARYMRQSKYDAAAEILTGGAKALLRAGSQQGASASGGDLAIMLVSEVYTKAEWEISEENDVASRAHKKRLIELLREFPPDEPSRKRYISEIIGWSSKFGPLERGDPELHHAVGSVYAEENEPYDAEKHLIIGTTDSAETLAKLEFEWYTGDESHTAALYASRAVIPFLLTGNLRSANKALLIFTSRLSSLNPSLASQQVSSASSDIRIYPSLPLLNFLGLLLVAVQRGSADLFRDLTRHYAPHIQEVSVWNDALAQIGEMYFNIKIPRQGNPLLDMMGSMFFGGNQSGGNQKPGASSRAASKRVQAAPSSAELD
ncbi:Golgi to ER traffic protein 4 [Talaromyces islandicus]|uniref:Golgi to ER traffic protein 4 n=1 Tax=Talaromyces islandicus TaxID=28573 RepID=A0A0U1LZQ2_TALIS|nr:Golgi to ER traffic protein 4 [Talaromyces islandicus]